MFLGDRIALFEKEKHKSLTRTPLVSSAQRGACTD